MRTLIKAAPYEKLQWLASDRYAVMPWEKVVAAPAGGLGNPPTPTPPSALVVKARSARWSGDVVAAASAGHLMTPVGASGDFIAADGGSLLLVRSASSPDKAQVRRVETPLLAGRVIRAIAVSADGAQLAIAAGRPGAEGGGAAILFMPTPKDGVASVSAESGRLVEIVGDGGSETPSNLVFSNDGKAVFFSAGGHLGVINVAAGACRYLPSRLAQPRPIASDGETVLVAGGNAQSLERLRADGGRALTLSEAVPGVIAGAFMPGRPIFWTGSSDGQVRYWDQRSGKLLLTFYSAPGNGFFSVTPEGRYDTNLGADAGIFRWVVADHPFQSLSAQTFMRQYYEPNLLARVLDCSTQGDCAMVFKPIPPVDSLDRELPITKIDGVRAGPSPFTATVDVTVGESGTTGPLPYDLRLFMNGRLVADASDAEPASGGTGDVGAWRAANALRANSNGLVRRSFLVDLPSDGRAVSFTAYAFNQDRVKGNTSPEVTFSPPPLPVAKRKKDSAPQAPIPWEQTASNRLPGYDGTDPTRRGRNAYVIAIGVNRYDLPGKSLQFAANDARLIGSRLGQVPGYRVVPIVLIADQERRQSTKTVIRAVLSLLGGDESTTTRNRAVLRAAGVDPAKLRKATPDDLVIVSFSGHGYVDAGGAFYLVPADARADETSGSPVSSTLISSDELAAWLRRINAGETALIIDACHSAASVAANGFRPGPMGDAGLGQLAFDKGIRILAATQSDDVALEDSDLKQGLLTYALVHEGLGDATHPGLATPGWGGVHLANLMLYALDRLPDLAAEVAGKRREEAASGLMLVPRIPQPSKPPRVQRPALFDFTDDDMDVVLTPLKPEPAVR